MKLHKVNKNMLVKSLVLLFMCLMLICPGASFRGASSGLLLWFHNVLPNLLPFIILSNLIVRLNITRQISKIFYPLLGKLFRISYEGCYPIVIGFLSGIPMGAKSTADLVQENKINRKEAQFLLGMCNNASPMFIIGYIAITQLKHPNINYALFIIIYGASILGSIIFRYFFSLSDKISEANQVNTAAKNNSATFKRFSFELLDNSIMNGFEIVTKIGGYIILFSIIAQIIKEIGPETSFIKATLMGILEITTGISQVCVTTMDIKMKIVLVCTLTTFGGFSAVAQTKSVLGDSRLSIYSYIIVKLISAILALLFSLLYISLFYHA